MKVAVLHDYIEDFSGSTRVLWDILDQFPESDLYTLFVDYREKKNEELNKRTGKVHTCFICKFPFFYKIPFFKTGVLWLARWYWEGLDLSNYDVVISSTFGFGAQAAIVGPEAAHVVYVHTPSKRLYSERVMIASKKNSFKNRLHNVFFGNYRLWDFVVAQKPDWIWSNSVYTKLKVKRNWARDSEVLYPRITSFSKYKYNGNEGEYYLYFGRLVLEKGIELIIKAFNENGKRLVIVGDGPKNIKQYLKRIAKDNIEFKGFIEEKELTKIFSKTKAMIFAAKGEDFGMAVAEMVVSGMPVIAYRGGGVKEIIYDGENGYLFDKYDIGGINGTIERMENQPIDKVKCRNYSKKFERQDFGEIIENRVIKILKEK